MHFLRDAETETGEDRANSPLISADDDSVLPYLSQCCPGGWDRARKGTSAFAEAQSLHESDCWWREPNGSPATGWAQVDRLDGKVHQCVGPAGSTGSEARRWGDVLEDKKAAREWLASGAAFVFLVMLCSSSRSYPGRVMPLARGVFQTQRVRFMRATIELGLSCGGGSVKKISASR